MIDFEMITACGECCYGCAKKENGICPGCIESDGKVPEWAESGRCKIHVCARKHKVQFCGMCPEFPCSELPKIIHWNPNIIEHLSQLREEYKKLQYGDFETATDYCRRNRTEEWIQRFLRSDGHNIALADGLLKEKRYYTDIVQFDIELLQGIKDGAPEYLNTKNDIEYFFSVVEEMNKAMNCWNPPPLIIEFRDDGKFYVCDGRHRLEMFRQKKVKTIPAIAWTTGKENFEKLREILKC